jgi:hypothetical protein
MTRQQRKLTVTIAPNFYPVYRAIAEYYGIHGDPSAVVNLCIHTVGKALGEKLAKEANANESKQEPADVAAENPTDSGQPT